MNIQTIIDKLDKYCDEWAILNQGGLELDHRNMLKQFLKDSLTSMLDGIEKELKTSYVDENNKQNFDYTIGYKERNNEVINIINSHR